MNLEPITAEDLEAIRYFWHERGDITRWCDWDTKAEALKAQFPEIVKAQQDYEASMKTMTAVLRGVRIREVK